MRVLIVNGYLPSKGGGGMQRHVYDLAMGLIERGVDVKIACENKENFPGDYSSLKDRLITVNLTSYNPAILRPIRRSRKLSVLADTGRYALHMLHRSWKLSRSFKPVDYDIIHTNSEHGLFSLLRIRLMRGNKPATLVTLHGTACGAFLRARSYNMLHPVPLPDMAASMAMEYGSAKLSDACIAVSHNVRRDTEIHYRLPEERVSVIYNWTDKSKFYPRGKAEARKVLGLDPDKKYLMFAGRADALKGYDLLIDAMKQVDGNAGLLVASKGTGKLGELGMKNVRLVGWLGDDDLPLYYSACDLLVFPSVSEGLPLTLIEGISCGAVPVCLNLPPMTEVVDTTIGYLCERFDPAVLARTINRALTDESLAEKSRRCIEKSAEFDMDTSIDATLALYQSIAGRG